MKLLKVICIGAFNICTFARMSTGLSGTPLRSMSAIDVDHL
jgi:hypothetical protein